MSIEYARALDEVDPELLQHLKAAGLDQAATMAGLADSEELPLATAREFAALLDEEHADWWANELVLLFKVAAKAASGIATRQGSLIYIYIYIYMYLGMFARVNVYICILRVNSPVYNCPM